MKTLFIIAVLHLTATTFLTPAPPEVAIIVNTENPVGQLSAGEVKLYWLRKIKKRWPVVNKNIKPVDRKTTNPDQDIFYSKVLGMSASDVETYFNQKQYESGEKPQDKFGSDDAIIDFVSQEVGAIGFVNASSLSAQAKSKVKIVLVIQ
jgi:ABC-type phosphate transport system substrate-binding protein